MAGAWAPELIWRLRANEVHLAAAVPRQLPFPQHLLVFLCRCSRHRSTHRSPTASERPQVGAC